MQIIGNEQGSMDRQCANESRKGVEGQEAKDGTPIHAPVADRDPCVEMRTLKMLNKSFVDPWRTHNSLYSTHGR